MIRYYLYQWQAKGNLQGLWFARAASDETLNLEALSEHMHSHNCPYSQGTILGVLRDAVKCTKELLLEGKKVKFDNLALFSVGIKGTGVLNQKEYSVQKNVDGLRLLARATGDLSTTRLFLDSQLKEVKYYGEGSVIDDTPNDGTDNTGGGEPSGGGRDNSGSGEPSGGGSDNTGGGEDYYE